MPVSLLNIAFPTEANNVKAAILYSKFKLKINLILKIWIYNYVN